MAEPRSHAGLAAQFELEQRLARRLREAPAGERPRLYSAVYTELFDELERLGLLAQVRQNDPLQTELLLALLGRHLEGVSCFLELGAGDGELARQIAQTIQRVIAVDAATRPGAASAAAHEPTGLELLAAEETGRISSDAVDIALSCHLVEHLHPEDLAGHLRDVHRVLRPGGRYLVVTPNRLLGPHDVSQHFGAAVASGLHLREYDHRQLARALRQAGFAQVRVLIGIGRPPSSWPLWPVALVEAVLELLPRRLRAAALDVLSRRPAPLRSLEQVKLMARRA